MTRPHSPRSRFPLTGLALAAAALLSAACHDPAPTEAHRALAHSGHGATLQAGAMTSEVNDQVARLRELTAPFQRFEAAVEAGWDTQITDCFENPGVGGMGYHYGNTALIDGRVNALEPELLLYEPQKNGRLRLVGVEYIVPFDLWADDEPPRLYDQPFHRNEAFGLWVLHVWHFQHNPSGMFMDWNPTISCRYAAS